MNLKPQGLPRERRVRKQRDFDRVYREDAFAADDVLVLRGCRRPGRGQRLGLSVSKKVGNAVVRNRWKRLIREAFRTQLADIPSGLDIVVRPRKGAQPNLDDIRRSLPKLAQKIARRLESPPTEESS
ncbi:MAG: ribonuclease P protein component [Pirellulaceae bacterium]|nr:ribonuclease P protein component [Pirellulaceae bacterium]